MKKFRLVVSIAMMFVSLAVFCFGVYAASSVTYTISGTIKYEIQDVFCTITGNVYTVSEQQDTSAMSSAITSLTSKALSSIADSTYTLADTITQLETDGTTTSGTKSLNISFANGKYTYYIVLHIKNNAGKAFTASLTDSSTGSGYVKSSSSSKTVAVSGSSGDETNMIIAYSLSSKTSDINATLSTTLTCSY